MYSKTIISSILIILLTFYSSCKKLIEIDPPISSITGEEIYNSNATAISVVTGILADMSQGTFTGRNSLSIILGLSADELGTVALQQDILSSFYNNGLTNTDGGIWPSLYAYIFRINSAIEGIESSTGTTTQVKNRLLGECRFLRAFIYFYLANLYGDVPLLLTTDLKINSTASREQTKNVYLQIITDLKTAQSLLSDEYLSGDLATTSSERIRPNKAVATALLARVYLFTNDFEGAEIESTKLIDNPIYKLEELTNVFLRSSKECIWQLQTVLALSNTLEAQTFVLKGDATRAEGPNTNNRPVYLATDLFNQFNIGDKRKQTWTDSVIVDNTIYPFAYKYKVWKLGEPVTEYLTVFRLAEQLLIRSEARANLNKLSGTNSSLQDINTIRIRAGLEPITALSKEDLLAEIFKQRQFELFTEWGHRWLDLKRSGKIDIIMQQVSIQKGGIWSSYKALFPIPASDIQRNPSLKGHQNPGYLEL